MKRVIAVLLAAGLFLVTSNVTDPVLAQSPLSKPDYIGFSTYGILGKNYPCESLISTISRLNQHGIYRAGIALLAWDFGKDTFCINQIKLTAALSNVELEQRFYFSNESCRRGNRCGKGSFAPEWSTRRYDAELKRPSIALQLRIRERVTEIDNFTDGLKSLVIGLEDNLSRQSAQNLVKIIRGVWTHEIIRNPMAGSDFAGADSLELHTPDWRKHIPNSSFSNDGFSLVLDKPAEGDNFNISMSALQNIWRKSPSQRKWFWLPFFNCREPADRFSEPARRNCENYIGSSLGLEYWITQVAGLSNP